jgi:hypothetical protein
MRGGAYERILVSERRWELPAAKGAILNRIDRSRQECLVQPAPPLSCHLKPSRAVRYPPARELRGVESADETSDPNR